MRLGVTLSCVLAGCFKYSPMPPEPPPPELRKIGDAQILQMKVHLHKQPGLCPGKRGKLYANANVQWPASRPVARSIGRDVDSLAPSSFSVSGPLVRGDADANLLPDPDVLKSVETGFSATIVYTPIPTFSFSETFPPEYSCYTGWYNDGSFGNAGFDGRSGDSGGEGQSGAHGEHGRPGGRGGSGGRVTAYVTIVSTRYYPKLLAVWANDRFFLAPANRPLGFGAAGGQGGTGGTGGYGGNGGDQPTESKEVYEDGTKTTVTVARGAPGNGGDAGDGGPGGSGGDGGIVEVTYDASFPELRNLIQTDVSGGAGGYGGRGGDGGRGGGTNADQNYGAQEGQDGQGGQAGADGPPGRVGRATVRPGSVASKFQGLRGIGIFGSAAAAQLQKQGPLGSQAPGAVPATVRPPRRR